MDRVKKYDKYTILSELNRLIGNNAPIKGTYVKTLKHDDIFETNVNKTTELHAIKSGNKRILVPLVKEEPLQEGSISESQLLKLLRQVKNPQSQRILREYLAQNKEIDKEIVNDRLINRTIHTTEKAKKKTEKEDMEILKMIIGNTVNVPLIEYDNSDKMRDIIRNIKKARSEGNKDDEEYYLRKGQELTGHKVNKKKQHLLAVTYRGEDQPKPKPAPSDEDTDGDENNEAIVQVEDVELDKAEVLARRTLLMNKINKDKYSIKTIKSFEKFLIDNGHSQLASDLLEVGEKSKLGGLNKSIGTARRIVENRVKITAEKELKKLK